MTSYIKTSLKWGIVLAAGFGKRLRPVTNSIPKPLVELGGTTLLDHAIQNLIDVGITDIVVNGHYKSEMIRRHIKDHWSKVQKITIHFIHEVEILETGGAVLNIMRHFNIKKALVTNSDIFFINNKSPAFSSLVHSTLQGNLILMIQNYKLALQKFKQGDFQLRDGNKIIFNHLERGDYLFLGAYIVDISLFKDKTHIHKFSMLNYIQQNDITNYKFTNHFAVLYEGKFLDIGTLELLKDAKIHLASLRDSN